jgi:glycosyltransferase involved in cell wall biosynthesis
VAKIVHWGKYYPPDMGGIESVTSSLAGGAVAAGHTVTVVCFDKGDGAQEQLLDGVRVLRAPIGVLTASQPLGWRYLRWILREGRKAEVVHLHGPNMLAALSGLLISRVPKLVVHWHSDVVGKGMLGRLFQPLERALLRRADRIVCTSSAYAEASVPLRPFMGKISVVPIGVADVKTVAADEGSAMVLPPELDALLHGRRLVLAVGRLVPYKGFHVLVDAARQLPPDVMVLIVGDGLLRHELQARIDSAGTSNRVVLAGRLGDAALQTLFQRAALFCLPSVERSEAFGVVLVEAMAHGLPVVATLIPGSGVPWVNRHDVSGFNVPVGDADALAGACNQILGSDSEHARLSAGARQRFVTEFTEQVSVNRMLAVYDSLLTAPKSAANG